MIHPKSAEGPQSRQLSRQEQNHTEQFVFLIWILGSRATEQKQLLSKRCESGEI